MNRFSNRKNPIAPDEKSGQVPGDVICQVMNKKNFANINSQCFGKTIFSKLYTLL